MKSVLIQDETTPPGQEGAHENAAQALVTATDVTRRYGKDGDLCVKALRGVSLDVAGGKLHSMPAGEIEHGLETEVPVEMAVQIQQRISFVNHAAGGSNPNFGQG